MNGPRQKPKRISFIWDEWHVRDLQDMILRDRNHPSIIAWSIGNEIREQFDTTGISITKELAGIVKELDKTRPVTSALTEQDPEKNNIYKSGALDLISFNYKHKSTWISLKIIQVKKCLPLKICRHYLHEVITICLLIVCVYGHLHIMLLW